MRIRAPLFTNYPPSSMVGSGAIKQDKVIRDLPTEGEAIVYVHIPFCHIKCKFCYLLVYDNPTDHLVDEYLSALKSELLIVAPFIKNRKIKAVHIGGGTPTSLGYRRLEGLIVDLWRNLNIDSTTQISIEAHPNYLSCDQLKMLKNVQVRRISFGIQSLDKNVLNKIGSNSSYSSVAQCYDQCLKYGIDNVNFDLMYNLPGQTHRSLQNTLNQVIAIEPMHLSFFAYVTDEDQLSERDAKIRSKHYDLIYNYFAGSNYSVSGVNTFATEHNEPKLYPILNRECVDRWGLGLGSYSYFNGFQFRNTPDLVEYLRIAHIGEMPIESVIKLNKEDQIRRKIIFGLQRIILPKKRINDFGVALIKDQKNLIRNNFIAEVLDNIILTPLGMKYLYFVQSKFFSKKVNKRLNVKIIKKQIF